MKKVLIGIAGLLILFVAIGLVLPSDTQVERTVTIKADKDTVHSYLNNMKNFNRWSPWVEFDPAATYSYSGPESGVGASMSWQSEDPSVGTGSQEIIASSLEDGIAMRLNFGEQGDATSQYILTSTAPSETSVTWKFETDFGYDIVGRYFGLVMDSMIGPSYEKGLEKLKSEMEQGDRVQTGAR